MALSFSFGIPLTGVPASKERPDAFSQGSDEDFLSHVSYSVTETFASVVKFLLTRA